MIEQQREETVHHQAAARCVCVICGSQFAPKTRTHGEYGLCGLCTTSERLREQNRIESYRKRLPAGASCDLTLVGWLEIIASWRGLCAICEQVRYSHIDRIGETIIPSCWACHTHLHGNWQAALDRIRAYDTP